MTSRPPVIELEAVGRTFSSTPPVRAVRDVDLVVDSGEYLAIVGPSGSGKSTLLTLLGLLDRPTAGRYRLEGMEVTRMSDRDLATLRAHRVGFVFQAFHLLAHRTAVENVELALLYRRSSDVRARSLAALDRVGLGHRAEFLPSRLSGGEQQRVAIARAIVGKPAILLCDEPTGNLDSATSDEVLSVFEELWSDGITLVVVSHDPAVATRARRVLAMRDGRALS